jgi:hypothetical protein
MRGSLARGSRGATLGFNIGTDRRAATGKGVMHAAAATAT